MVDDLQTTVTEFLKGFAVRDFDRVHTLLLCHVYHRLLTLVYCALRPSEVVSDNLCRPAQCAKSAIALHHHVGSWNNLDALC